MDKGTIWFTRGLCVAWMFMGVLVLQAFGSSCVYGTICTGLDPFEAGIVAQLAAIPVVVVIGAAGVLAWTFMRRNP